MTKKKLPQASSKRAVSIVRSSAAEYLTFVAAAERLPGHTIGRYLRRNNACV